MTFQSINPYTRQVIASYEAESPEAIQQKIALASQAQQHWRLLTMTERGEQFKKLAVYLREHKESLAQLITDEMGKIIAEARAEVEKCAAQCDYYAEHAAQLIQADEIPTEAAYSGVQYQPLGVVFAIMPWNFPFWQVFRYAVPALMAGNATILKHAPNVFGCALAIEKAFRESGFEPGVFQAVVCDVDAVEAILADDRIAMVTLTGSERAGASVAALAGKYIKKSVLELGGSDPLIVLPDADLEQASTAAVASRMMNAGQVCIAAKRFLVHASVKDEFVALLQQKLGQLTTGDPNDPAVKIGPLARLDLAENLEKQLEKALAQGAAVLHRGRREGCLMEPSLLEVTDTQNVVFQEETFGPIAVVKTFDTEEEAVALANQSAYGLSAAVWTRNQEKARKLASQLEAGSVFVNAVVRSDSRLPIGGTKRSGYGKELSEIGIKEFCVAKVVYIA
jgi:succinate-semialdehyde dehydrogenase/glutarate-semialdehyde dehydrogenase